MVAWFQVALAGAFGGLLALERRAFLQAMFSRPLVAATLIGALLDDVESGLYVGMVLELFHLGSANLGAALSENETLAATGTAAAACGLSHGAGGSTAAVWSVAILFFIGLGPLGRLIDRALDAHTTRLSVRALASAEQGDLTRAVRQNLWGMWPHFLLFGAVTALCYLVGALAAPAFRTLSLESTRGLAWAYPAIASVAAALAARGSHAKRAAAFAGAAAAVVTVTGALWASFGGRP
jgi:mannose/fructose/N-acetylgalactosamine-specific phosphotransferase system component IIC